MSSTFHCLHYHVIFSTKGRHPWLMDTGVRERVWAFMGGIANDNGTKPICIGGIEDHVHLLLEIPPRLPISDVVKHNQRWIVSLDSLHISRSAIFCLAGWLCGFRSQPVRGG